MLQYFLQSRLNPNAVPYIPNIVLPDTFHNINKNDNNNNNNINVNNTNSNANMNIPMWNTKTRTHKKHRQCSSDPLLISTPINDTSEWITPLRPIRHKKLLTKLPSDTDNRYSILSFDTQDDNTIYHPSTNNKPNNKEYRKPICEKVLVNINNDSTQELQEIDSAHQTITQRLYLSSIHDTDNNI